MKGGTAFCDTFAMNSIAGLSSQTAQGAGDVVHVDGTVADEQYLFRGRDDLFRALLTAGSGGTGHEAKGKGQGQEQADQFFVHDTIPLLTVLSGNRTLL